MSPLNPPQAAQDNPKPDTPFQTNIVTNIPIHTAGGTAPPPAPAAQPQPQNAEDPDKIMRDVGDELKKEDINQPKHHFWNKKPDASQQTKFSAHPVPRGAPQPTPAPSSAAAQPHPAPAAAQPARPAIPPAPPKPKSSVPVMAILVTLVVTGGLIALAVVSLS